MDSYSFWGIKSREIYLHGTLTDAFLAASYPHPSYPVLGPILEAAAFRAAGGPSDGAAALLGPIALAFSALVILGATIDRLPWPWPAALASVLVLAPRVIDEAQGSLMDIHVAAMALAGVAVLARAGSSRSQLALAGAFLGLAGFAKNDGIPWAAAGVMSALLIGRGMASRLSSAAAVAAGSLATLGPWLAFRFSHGLRTDIVNAEVLASLTPRGIIGQVRPVLSGLIPYAFGFSSAGRGAGYDGAFVFVAAAIVLLALSRRLTPVHALAAIVLAQILGVYCMLPPVKLAAHTNYLATTGFRILLQIYPAALYLASEALARPGSRHLEDHS
jgi:hypothetical protein